MNPIIQRKIAELADICNKDRVRRLVLFGSATSDHFEPTSSDLDLLVEFEPMLPAQHADNYFSLMEDLQRLFGVQVDLVEPGPMLRSAVILSEAKNLTRIVILNEVKDLISSLAFLRTGLVAFDSSE